MSTARSQRPTVTVAICTCNRAELLEGTLADLTNLTPSPSLEWEVLVVDNGSTDSTPEVVQRYADRLPLRGILEPRKGLSHARNRSAAEARFEWILFTDDDVRIAPTWLETFAAAVERHPEASVAGGPIDPWFPVAPDPLLLEVFPELARGFCGVDHDVEEGPLAAPREVYGANFAVRRSLFETMLFDPSLGVPRRLNEDTEFVNRVREAGGLVLWIPTMRVRHYVSPARLTPSYLRKYRSLQGATRIQLDPLPAAPSMLGAPRWLWRKWLASYARYVGWRVVGNRRNALMEMRNHSLYEGMIRQARHDRSASNQAA